MCFTRGLCIRHERGQEVSDVTVGLTETTDAAQRRHARPRASQDKTSFILCRDLPSHTLDWASVWQTRLIRLAEVNGFFR